MKNEHLPNLQTRACRGRRNCLRQLLEYFVRASEGSRRGRAVSGSKTPRSSRSFQPLPNDPGTSRRVSGRPLCAAGGCSRICPLWRGMELKQQQIRGCKAWRRRCPIRCLNRMEKQIKGHSAGLEEAAAPPRITHQWIRTSTFDILPETRLNFSLFTGGPLRIQLAVAQAFSHWRRDQK